MVPWLTTLQANLQAKVDGNCSMSNATGHVAEPGACTEAGEHISSGGPWCTHCSMTNHATDDCGTLHGSSSRGGRSGRSGRGGRGGRGGRNGRGTGRGARGKAAATATLHKLQAQVLALEAKRQQQPAALRRRRTHSSSSSMRRTAVYRTVQSVVEERITTRRFQDRSSSYSNTGIENK